LADGVLDRGHGGDQVVRPGDKFIVNMRTIHVIEILT
jgi:hypothetical protein